MVNNIRDIKTDQRAGKNTLAVKLGDKRARKTYVLTLYVAFLSLVPIWVLTSLPAWILISLLAICLVPSLSYVIKNKYDGPSLNNALAKTGLLQLAFCSLLSIGLLIG